MGGGTGRGGAGRRVGLVRAAPGATAMVAGGWAGPLPEPLGAALARAGMPFEPASSPLPHPAGRLDGYALAAPAQRAATPLEARSSAESRARRLPGFCARARVGRP